jgi:hypothetical protein
MVEKTPNLGLFLQFRSAAGWLVKGVAWSKAVGLRSSQMGHCGPCAGCRNMTGLSCQICGDFLHVH